MQLDVAGALDRDVGDHPIEGSEPGQTGLVLDALEGEPEEAGDPLDEFLRQFPTVKREQAVAVIELAKRSLQAAGAA